MRRVLKWLIPLLLIAFGVLWPLVLEGGSETSDAEDPVVFSNYKADFVVNADGGLDAVETITAEFPGNDRHGIFRYWDVANKNNPHVRQPPETGRFGETASPSRIRFCGRAGSGSGSRRSAKLGAR